jgi:hypothetical protein
VAIEFLFLYFILLRNHFGYISSTANNSASQTKSKSGKKRQFKARTPHDCTLCCEEIAVSPVPVRKVTPRNGLRMYFYALRSIGLSQGLLTGSRWVSKRGSSAAFAARL